MKISALAPWFGSKRTLAPRIVEELGQHSAYWEPFCGSCAVLFAKDPACYESVNDLHHDLINLALVVQDETTGQQLYGRVARTLFDEGLMPTAKEIVSSQFGPENDQSAMLERAYWYLVASWMGLDGVSGTPMHHTGTFAARYSAKGGNGATRWRSVIDSIPDWHARLAGVQILRRDAFKLLDNLDEAVRTSIYIDPPYITKGAKYVHDFATEDHKRLAAALQRFLDARVVVSYYDHPIVDDLYVARGWTKVCCPTVKSMAMGGRRDKSKTEAPEVLLLNGPSFAGGQASLF